MRSCMIYVVCQKIVAWVKLRMCELAIECLVVFEEAIRFATFKLSLYIPKRSIFGLCVGQQTFGKRNLFITR